MKTAWQNFAPKQIWLEISQKLTNFIVQLLAKQASPKLARNQPVIRIPGQQLIRKRSLFLLRYIQLARESVICRPVEKKVDDAIPIAGTERAFVESCSFSCAGTIHPSRSRRWKQRIMFSPPRGIALNVAMLRRIRFARNNAAKTVEEGRAGCDGNARPVVSSLCRYIFSFASLYRARQRIYSRDFPRSATY